MADIKRNGGTLDERDKRLIALLEDSPRASLAELARALSLSPQSVSERLKRLEDVGVLGFSVALDPAMLGLSIGASSASSRRWANLPVSPRS